MCRSVVDIQSVAAEIRRGKKEIEDRWKETTGQKYNGPLLHRAAVMSTFVTLCISGIVCKQDRIAIRKYVDVFMYISSLRKQPPVYALCLYYK